MICCRQPLLLNKLPHSGFPDLALALASTTFGPAGAMRGSVLWGGWTQKAIVFLMQLD